MSGEPVRWPDEVDEVIRGDLAQGRARVDITPSRERLEALVPQGERYFGTVVRGPVWARASPETPSEAPP